MLKGILSEDAIWLENVETVNMSIWFKQKQFRDKDIVNYCVFIDKLLGLMGDVHLQQKYLFRAQTDSRFASKNKKTKEKKLAHDVTDLCHTRRPCS